MAFHDQCDSDVIMYIGHDVDRHLKRRQGDAAPQAVYQDLLEHLSHRQVQTRRAAPCFIKAFSIDRSRFRQFGVYGECNGADGFAAIVGFGRLLRGGYAEARFL